jgi:hypothetical protein
MKNVITLLLITMTLSLSAQFLPDDIDISGSENGVILVPANIDAFWVNNFSLYTKYITPNGGSIHIIGQSEISIAQMVQVRNILTHYLMDYPGSVFGSDKSAVANMMAENNAQMIIYNGYDGEFNIPEAEGQWLFEDEIVVDGSNWYIDTSENMYEEHRDATFEETLHMMHDFGIGVDGPNSHEGALPAYQAEIRTAQSNALLNNLWGISASDWIAELTEENSLSQEYLASVIDSYYGLWGAYTGSVGGMWGIYVAKTREDISNLDLMGAELLNNKYFSPYLQYYSQLSSEFDGTFIKQFDLETPYTHKSQYLLNVNLTGTNNSNISGNNQDNLLSGNLGNNILDGLDGEDTAEFEGLYSSYSFSFNGANTVIEDQIAGRDGIDTVINVEFLKFYDQTIPLVELSIEESVIRPDFRLTNYPNPFNPTTRIEYNITENSDVRIDVFNTKGQLVNSLVDSRQNAGEHSVIWNGMNQDNGSVPSGIYFYRLQTNKTTVTNKMLLLK